VSAGAQARVAGLSAVAVGIAAALGARDLGVGSLTDPGPGLWPLVVSAVLAITGAVVAVRPGDDAEAIGRDAWTVVVACVTLVAYTAVIRVVGFELPTIALLAVWMRMFGGEPWRTTVAVSVGVTVVVYLVFILALGVALPHLA
jgi:putative tricarboxylic transport membrane protein